MFVDIAAFEMPILKLCCISKRPRNWRETMVLHLQAFLSTFHSHLAKKDFIKDMLVNHDDFFARSCCIYGRAKMLEFWKGGRGKNKEIAKNGRC